MRQTLSRLVILFLFASLSLVAQAEITIGVVLSTTGPAAALGIPEKNAASLGPAMIAGEKVRYIVFDDASDPTMAVQQVKRLIAENKIDVLLGPTTSPSALAVIDTVAEAQTPMISVASVSAIVAPMDKKRQWVFKTPSNDDVHAMVMASHMASRGVKSVSVIAVDDAHGEANTAAFRKFAIEKGIDILTVEKFNRSDTSVTAQALHAIKGKPDAIYIIAVGTPAVTPQRALVEQRYKGKIYQSAAAASIDFLRLGGKEVEGTYMPSMCTIVAEQLPDSYPTKEPALQFIKAYESKYGLRSAFATNTWDALRLLEAAIPAALKSAKPGTVQFRESLRTAIENIKGYRGAGAVYNMSPTDHTGTSQVGMCMIRIQGANWKLEQYAQ